jgi:hypothetical protein
MVKEEKGCNRSIKRLAIFFLFPGYTMIKVTYERGKLKKREKQG